MTSPSKPSEKKRDKNEPITPPLPEKKEDDGTDLPVVEPKVQSVKGMRDIAPLQQKAWQEVRGVCEGVARGFSYLRIDTPFVEKTDLFVRGVGKETDIVQKEMFTFKDKSNASLSLIPEGTAGTARAFIEQGLHKMPSPLKVYKTGPRFRREQPQKGRYRQFFQFDMDILGAETAAVDAEIMFMTYKILRRLGLNDVMFHVNSLGDAEDRKAYREALVAYFKGKTSQLNEIDRRRLKTNPLRVLDSKDKGAMKLAKEAPHMVDYLSEESNKHFTSLLEYLDEMGVPYTLNPKIVRGLDYYNRTVFEVVAGGSDESHAVVASGGRYDGLIEQLGGHETPAVGVALGMDRLVDLMIEQKIMNENDSYYKQRTTDVFFAQLGELSKRRMMTVLEQLVDEGFNVAFAMGKDSLRSQLRLANKHDARITLILGQKEAMEGSILIRDMESGVQELISADKVIKEVKKRLKSSGVTVQPAAHQSVVSVAGTLEADLSVPESGNDEDADSELSQEEGTSLEADFSREESTSNKKQSATVSMKKDRKKSGKKAPAKNAKKK